MKEDRGWGGGWTTLFELNIELITSRDNDVVTAPTMVLMMEVTAPAMVIMISYEHYMMVVIIYSM